MQTKYPTINLHFGHRHKDTLTRFDCISQKIRQSRTGTLEYLVTYYELNERQRVRPILL